MDVTNPEVYWIDNRCYRKNPSTTPLSSAGNYSQQWSSSTGGNTSTLPPYIEHGDVDEYSCDPDAPNEDAHSYKIEATTDGEFKTSCDNVHPSFFAIIVGTKAQTKLRLERDTRTKIIIPKPNEKGTIVIRGRNEKDVVTARRRIDLMVSQSRMKRDPTHFPCFPLNSAEMIQSMNKFKEQVLEECGSSVRGIDEDLFTEPEKAHLTFCVLTLLDEKERLRAKEILDKCQAQFHDKFGVKGGLTVRIKGLEIMNDDPTQVDVLYAKCQQDPSGNKLQNIADFVVKAFVESGFAKPNRGDQVKLHCTLLNSRKKAERLGEREKGCGAMEQKKRETFDASLILSKFKDFDFGSVSICRINLATRFTSGPDGFYKSFHTIQL